jgi:hypothetical protein
MRVVALALAGLVGPAVHVDHLAGVGVPVHALRPGLVGDARTHDGTRRAAHAGTDDRAGRAADALAHRGARGAADRAAHHRAGARTPVGRDCAADRAAERTADDRAGRAPHRVADRGAGGRAEAAADRGLRVLREGAACRDDRAGRDHVPDVLHVHRAGPRTTPRRVRARSTVRPMRQAAGVRPTGRDPAQHASGRGRSMDGRRMRPRGRQRPSDVGARRHDVTTPDRSVARDNVVEAPVQ